MGVNPNHPNPPRRSHVPQGYGDRLATFERHGGEEVQVNLTEFNGHLFVWLRVWAPGPDAQV